MFLVLSPCLYNGFSHSRSMVSVDITIKLLFSTFGGSCCPTTAVAPLCATTGLDVEIYIKTIAIKDY